MELTQTKKFFLQMYSLTYKSNRKKNIDLCGSSWSASFLTSSRRGIDFRPLRRNWCRSSAKRLLWWVGLRDPHLGPIFAFFVRRFWVYREREGERKEDTLSVPRTHSAPLARGLPAWGRPPACPWSLQSNFMIAKIDAVIAFFSTFQVIYLAGKGEKLEPVRP